MAALMALEECGLGNAFDHVFGSSAGAVNAAYMLAQQAAIAVTVYLDDISNKNFVNFFRLNKIVDIDFLVDGVLKRHKALDVNKVIRSKSMLHIILTDYETGEPVVLTNRDNNFDLMEVIRATAAMPILYNKVVQVNGKGYIDGGLRDAVPLRRAIEQGCTDIIVILTREPGFRRKAPNLFMRLIETPFLRHHPKGTKQLVLSEDKQFNSTMDIILDPSLAGFDGRLAVVHPSDMSRMVSRTTNDRSKLLACALMARNDTRAILGLPPLHDNPFTDTKTSYGRDAANTA
jgi:predicted patatin/cPLA2 family phospholipase